MSLTNFVGCKVTILKKNGNKKLKNYFDYLNDTKATLKYKRGIIASLKLDTPLFSWPKDKLTLLKIINTYLANIKLDSLNHDSDYDVLDNLIKAVDGVMEDIEKSGKKSDKESLDSKDKQSDSKVDTDESNTDDKDSDTDENSTEDLENAKAESSEVTDQNSNDETDVKDDENPTDSEFESDEDMPDYVDESEYIDLPDQINDIEDVSAKMLGNIVRILNYRYKVLRKIDALKENRAPVEMVNDEIEKVAVYNIVLGKYLPILNKQKVVDTANIKTATTIFDDVCLEGYEDVPTEKNIESEIKKNKEQQDFDIVAALSYVGVSVDKDELGIYIVKNTNNGNGIKYYIGKQEKAFALSKKACNKFLDTFLNQPIETRKYITPGQVFIAYINEAERSLGINSRSATELSDLFGTMNNNRNAKAYFKDAIRKYSRNAEEWKNFQKIFEAEYYSNKDKRDEGSNRVHIKQQAKRLVIGDMMEEFLNEGDILTADQLNISDYRIGDISRDFGLDIDLDEIKVNRLRVERIEDNAFRIINVLHSSIQDMRAFVQDIIDNYTVDYLRKEKIFLLQQDDQNEYITKKKQYEDLIEKLSYDKAKDSNQQIAYYQAQIDDITQKIGNIEYRESKEDLIKSKNNFRILLLYAKSQKELVKSKLNDAYDKASLSGAKVSIDEKLNILKETLTEVPDINFAFDKGKVMYYYQKPNEKPVRREEKLSQVDKTIESTAARISDESHQKILEENKIREALKKSQKEERIKSANAYINAYGSIVGNAGGVGVLNNLGQSTEFAKSPTFAKSIGTVGGASPIILGNNDELPTRETYAKKAPSNFGQNNISNAGTTNSSSESSNTSAGGNSGSGTASGSNANAGSQFGQGTQASGGGQVGGVVSAMPGVVGMGAPTGVVGMAPMGYMMPNMQVPNPPMYNRDYQAFDMLSEGIEPCVIPFVVGFENKGVTTYGNYLEDYATYDRYKFLLLTNNNILYSYLETKKAQIQTPEQIISDMHIRYVKNAMAKSGLSTLDSNLAVFDYKSDLRKFLTKYVPQNMLDIVISDYNDLVSSVNFDLLKDVIEHKFQGDLESYVPEKIKSGAIKSCELIATLVKTISADANVRRTYEEYSSKMKQTYVSSLITRIENNEIPSVKIDKEQIQSRLLDYLSFSIKGQNVIIQNEDNKDSGLGTYPRSIYFKQKENADTNIKFNKVLSYEQNDIVTTRNEDMDLKSDVTNLFGVLYKFNGGYNKLLLKLKPYYLTSGVKFMENLVDALREKIDVKATVLYEETKTPIVPLVKFASKEKEKRDESEANYNYDDDKWYVRPGFVLDKTRLLDFALLLAFGRKYALEKDKTHLKEDFYEKDILSLSKINSYFSDLSEDVRLEITSVIRNVMMSRCERYIDFIDAINDDASLYFNRMLYINRMLMESNSFDRKTTDEKKETVETLESGFNTMSEDLVNPHPEIYSSIDEIEHYERLFMYFALNDLFEKYGEDKRIVCPELEEFFADKKKELRTTLLAQIRDKEYINGYELEMAEYFELNTEKVVTMEEKQKQEVETQEDEQKERIKIKNIDVIFKGIYDGFEKAVKDDKYVSLQDTIDKLRQILGLCGTLPSIDSEEKDLEIALPNNQTIRCNIKGFIEQYLFRFIIDKEHELGPFAYVVKELEATEEFSDIVKNLEEVANILNSEELGINLIAKFSSINLSNNGNIFKIGDNISTVVETVNRLKTPTDMQKALNRDVFYREGVSSCQKAFEQYFNRRKLENMQ